MLKEYGFVRVGSAVPNLKVADVEYNTREIINEINKASEKQVQILCFPELAITSYTCSDLFNQDILLDSVEKSLIDIKKATKNLSIVVIVGAPLRAENKIFNTAIVIQNGEILGVVPKTYIPNYNEFYEKRWFASAQDAKQKYINILDEKIPFGTDLLFKDKQNKEICFGIEICEDLWVVNPPSNSLTVNGATMIFNLSASSFP